MPVKGTSLDDALQILLLQSKEGGTVTLDAIGDALGARAVTHEEIDSIVARLEKAGRIVGEEPKEGVGVARLRKVVETGRALRAELGRSASPEEIAASSGLDLAAVRHALELAKVMQR
jgi:hypothetical protein